MELNLRKKDIDGNITTTTKCIVVETLNLHARTVNAFGITRASLDKYGMSTRHTGREP